MLNNHFNHLQLPCPLSSPFLFSIFFHIFLSFFFPSLFNFFLFFFLSFFPLSIFFFFHRRSETSLHPRTSLSSRSLRRSVPSPADCLALSAVPSPHAASATAPASPTGELLFSSRPAALPSNPRTAVPKQGPSDLASLPPSRCCASYCAARRGPVLRELLRSAARCCAVRRSRTLRRRSPTSTSHAQSRRWWRGRRPVDLDSSSWGTSSMARFGIANSVASFSIRRSPRRFGAASIHPAWG